MAQFISFKSKIPANKFYPPRFDTSQNILRQRLVEEVLGGKGGRKQVILIEAQAGQGKTTLAIQYLDHARRPYAWYQIGEEDSDPILLLTALISCLKKAVPAFHPAQLEAMLQCGDVTPQELERCANILLADLDGALHTDFHLVFDDLHHLEGHDHSLALLDYLVTTAPPRLRFIMLSRHPVRLKRLLVKFVRSVLRIGNEALALSLAEARQLLQEVMEVRVSEAVVAELHRATDGWAMGLILAGHALKHGVVGLPPGSVIDLSKQAILNYFQQEIFAQLPKATKEALLRCALLDEMPVELAATVSGLPEIGKRLAEMMHQNLFVRALNPQQTVFSLHHLFREFLRQQGDHTLTAVERNTVLNSGGIFYFGEALPGQALSYFLRAGNYDAMEQVLRQDGMDLLAHNRTVTLAIILDRVPAEVAQGRGWILLFSALAHWGANPSTVLPRLESARELFSRRDDKVGELLTLAQLIFYHWVAAGTFNAGAGLLSRAEALFTEVREELPPIATVLVAKNLAAGFCYFKTDMARASLYSNLALQMARRHQIKNCIASLLLIQGYEHLMLGHRTLNLQELEEAQELIDDPQVGSLNRLSLRLMQLNDLEMHGDFDNFAHQEAGLINLFGRNAIRGSAIGPLLSIWHAAILVAGDKLDEARQRLTVELEGRAKGLPPHLQSQLLQWLAYILALAGDKKRALTTAAESAALRAEAGGPFFMTVNDLLLGATHALLDRADVAETLLDHALSRALQFGIDYCAAAALLQRASLRLKKGGVSAARDDLTTGLRLMRQHGYHHFWGWTPQTVTPLLAAAVRDRIERSYARKLAAEKLGVMLLNDGSAIPLLAFRTFGRLTLAVDDRIVLSAEDLTPAQRELLALLIAAPGQRLGQEQIQLALWPESPPEKARSKFDSLLLRLRKTMGDAIKPHRMQHYLSLKKGILCLEGVRIDANDCARLARQGLHHCRRQEWWQAGNAFHGAASLWRGCFLPDIFGAEPVDDYRLELHTLFVELSTQWGHHLVDQGNLDEAARVIAAALKCQKGNLELTSLLHGLYLKNNNPLAAQQVLREFEALLRAEDYQADEITALLASVTSPPSQPLT